MDNRDRLNCAINVQKKNQFFKVPHARRVEDAVKTNDLSCLFERELAASSSWVCWEDSISADEGPSLKSLWTRI